MNKNNNEKNTETSKWTILVSQNNIRWFFEYYQNIVLCFVINHQILICLGMFRQIRNFLIIVHLLHHCHSTSTIVSPLLMNHFLTFQNLPNLNSWNQPWSPDSIYIRSIGSKETQRPSFQLTHKEIHSHTSPNTKFGLSWKPKESESRQS